MVVSRRLQQVIERARETSAHYQDVRAQAEKLRERCEKSRKTSAEFIRKSKELAKALKLPID